jgi:hypothetical protein
MNPPRYGNRFRHWPFGLIIASHFLLGVAQISIWPVLGALWLVDKWWSNLGGFMLPFICVMAVSSSQHLLLGFWLVFTPGRWWVRLLILLCSLIWFVSWQRASSLLSIGTMLCSAVFFLAVYRWRYQIAKIGKKSEGLVNSRWQFSLLDLAYAATIIAMFFALPRLVVKLGAEFIAEALGVPMALVACWSMLGQHRIWLPGMATLILAVLYALLFIKVSYDDYYYEAYEIIVAFVIHTTLLLLAFWFVRLCGYRLVSRRRSPEDLAQSINTGGHTRAYDSRMAVQIESVTDSFSFTAVCPFCFLVRSTFFPDETKR